MAQTRRPTAARLARWSPLRLTSTTTRSLRPVAGFISWWRLTLSGPLLPVCHLSKVTVYRAVTIPVEVAGW